MEKSKNLKLLKLITAKKLASKLYTPVSQTWWDPFPSGKICKKIIPSERNTVKFHTHWNTELSSPLGRTPKFWKSPLDFCAVNNRILSKIKGFFHPH